MAGACVPGGWGLAKESWRDFASRRLDIHFLMLAAALASAALGHWQEAALLLVLFSGSEALEAYANYRTETALASLFKDAPRTALRVASCQDRRRKSSSASKPKAAMLP